jgi:threonyl-tRNA synthetase
MLGSVERMMAVLTEHWGGKWPFWISPRQCIVVPVGPSHIDYAKKVRAQIRAARFYVDCDDSGHTLPKKIRNAQLSQYNFILVVGDNEIAENAVAVRTRANTVEGTMPVSKFIERCVELRDTKAKDPPPPDVPEPVKGKGGGGKKK